MTERPYFSIGEVLGLLLEEFSDITISKIRFLESQGLIDPERTSSGYRKFYDADIERLRYILHEQKDNYLPLKVIKERLDGIDHTLPNPPRPTPTGASWASFPSTASDTTDLAPNGDSMLGRAHEASHADEASRANAATPEPAVPEPVATPAPPRAPAASAAAWAPVAAPSNSNPATEPVGPATNVDTYAPVGAAAAPSRSATESIEAGGPAAPPAAPPGGERDTRPPVLTVVRDAPPPADLQLSGAELCSEARIDPAVLRQLEEYGLIGGRALGTDTTYGPDALRIARIARRLLELGLEVRHLRTWRMSAEKEVGLFEQLVLPLLRQRNPNARHQATDSLTELVKLGGDLRELLVRAALAEYLER